MVKKKKVSAEKFYNSLIAVLWTELLFFIPSKDIPTEFLKKYPKLKEILDTILVMDKRAGPMVYKDTRSNKMALQKGTWLDKNVFKLLKRKSKTNQNEFNYILDKYFEQIEFMFYISEWTYENIIKNNIQNLDDNIKGLFLIQQKYYKKHFESITKHFYPTKQENPNGNYDVIETIESRFPDLLKKYRKEQPYELNSIEKEKVSSEVQNIKSTTKEEKQPLITEVEAELFLLKSVFGIN